MSRPSTATPLRIPEPDWQPGEKEKFPESFIKLRSFIEYATDLQHRGYIPFDESERGDIGKARNFIKAKRADLTEILHDTVVDDESNGWLQHLTVIAKIHMYCNSGGEPYKPENNRQVTFMAVQHNFIEEAAESNVKVMALFDMQWHNLTNMESRDGTLQGKLLYLPKTLLTLQYKYCIYDPETKSMLDEHWRTDCRKAYLPEFDDTMTLYDGAILVKLPSPFSRSDETMLRCKYYRQMLPDWVVRIRAKHNHPVELSERIKQATKHQTTYCFPFDEQEYTIEIKKVLWVYLENTIIEHMEMSEDEEVEREMIYESSLQLFSTVDYHFDSKLETEKLEKTADFVAKAIMQLHTVSSSDHLFDLSPRRLQKDKSRRMATSVLNMMRKLSTNESAHWVPLLPLLHVLRQTGGSAHGTDLKNEAWWGIEDLSNFIRALHEQHSASWTDWWVALEPFFKECVFLPYAFLKLLNHEQLIEFLDSDSTNVAQIPINGVLARIRNFVETTTQEEDKIQMWQIAVEYLEAIPEDQINRVVDNNTLELVRWFTQNIPTDEKIIGTRGTSATSLIIYLRLRASQAERCSEGDRKHLIDDVPAELSELFNSFKVAVAHESGKITSNEILMWERMFQCNVSCPEIASAMADERLKRFKERVDEVLKNNQQSTFELYLTQNIESQQMADVVAEAAHSIAKDLLIVHGKNERLFSQNTNNPKMIKLIEEALDRMWPEDDADTFAMLENIMSWGGFEAVYKYLRTEESLGDVISNRLGDTVRSLKVALEQLFDRTINFKQCHLLSSHKTKLFALCDLFDNTEHSHQEIDVMINKVMEDLQISNWKKFVKSLKAFWEKCSEGFKASDQSAIEHWLARDISTIPLQELCYPETNEVACEIIPEELRANILPYAELITKPMFHNICERALSQAKRNWEAVTLAYRTALSQYHTNVESLSLGTMRIVALEGLIRDYFDGCTELLLSELDTIINTKSTLEERKKQITVSLTIVEYCKVAGILVTYARDKLELAGDCDNLEDISKFKSSNPQLQEVNLTLEAWIEVIKEFTPDRIKCLKAYFDCKDFSTWVKKAVQRKDIAVFVDLVSNALGDDEKSTQKTVHLSNALIGYSPLLYDLELSNKDLLSFMLCCAQLWKQLEENSQLPKDMREAAKELKFYKSVKDLYKNIESDALDQVTNIQRETGIYSIGNIPDFTKDFQCIDDVIKLEYRHKDVNGVEAKRTLRFTDIKELQSKLTLLAGSKQKDYMKDIQAFDELLEKVEKVARAYIEIRNIGCILFADLLVIVHCIPNEETVEVKLPSIKKKIVGKKSEPATTSTHSQVVVEYLISTAEKWKNSMDNERREFPELNNYTTAQLVILRKELGAYWNDKRKKADGGLEKAIPLLAMIHDIKPDDLYVMLEKCEKLTKEISTIDYDAIIRDPQEYTQAIIASENAAKITTTRDDTFKFKLEKMWQDLLNRSSSSQANLLGIPHLGHVLRKLTGCQGKCHTRVLPDWLEIGKPILIAAPRNRTYSMVLTLYEADHEAPPPTRSHVLVCTKQTTAEEVNLFLDRAMKALGSLYCMVNCHLLNYDICSTIEKRLNEMPATTDQCSVLAFIYAEEENGAPIRAHLDKHQSRSTPPADTTTLKTYVAKLLTAENHYRSLCRLIKSDVSGVGKTLEKNNLCSKRNNNRRLTIPVYRQVDMDSIINRLMKELDTNIYHDRHDFIHIDIHYEVETGVDELLFNLLILRSLMHSGGCVWQTRDSEFYIIECMPHMAEYGCAHEMMDLLPATMCQTPRLVLESYKGHVERSIGFDSTVLKSPEWQMVLKYLTAHVTNSTAHATLVTADARHVAAKTNGDDVPKPHYIGSIPEVQDKPRALELLLRNCGIRDPSWAELEHYVHFLYNQLVKLSSSPFMMDSLDEVFEDLPHFVVDFTLKMAKDFSPRSQAMTEEAPGQGQTSGRVNMNRGSKELQSLAIKKTWENSQRPYWFINEDGVSFTPLGFKVEQIGATRYLMDSEKPFVVFKDYSLSRSLYHQLHMNRMPFSESFNELDRRLQLSRLIHIIVNTVRYCNYNHEPDEDYVLNLDNAKKMVVIHQRLRAGIPVIVMGETGCGKTKLVEFMSKLQVPDELQQKLTPLMTLMIHGGTTEADIRRKVEEGCKLAVKNREICEKYADSHYERQMKKIKQPQAGGDDASEVSSGTEKQTVVKEAARQVPHIRTVLFLDEVNTTAALGLVKEILCDNRMDGKPLNLDEDLRIVAVCNPYRMQPESMIKKLKDAGLGFTVGKPEKQQTIGGTPLRELVYRVHPLPQSLLPLVWDFGTLESAAYCEDHGGEGQTDLGEYEENDAESQYILHMIAKFERTNAVDLKFDKSTPESVGKQDEKKDDENARKWLVVRILSRSQTFMRNQEDECSYVSLRDIQRMLDVMAWFYQHREKLFPKMKDLLTQWPDESLQQPEPEVLSLLLAIGVCYVAQLDEATGSRSIYADYISLSIEKLIGGDKGAYGNQLLLLHLQLCQQVFVNEVIDKDQHQQISKNKALMENIFMMVICIENRIPLFVIGKPGSSKSLARSLVFEAMKGSASKSDLFTALKQMHTESFQCSKLSSPENIIKVFKRCAAFQQSHDLMKYVSVVVLEEAGLAEDSADMPLKVLHPLLDKGCEDSTTPEPYMKCAFIGISNWALDPAKMNRGIFIQRGPLDKDELMKTAKDICTPSEYEISGVSEIIAPLAQGFTDICEWQAEQKDMREFFGLRDYYSLIKMAVSFAKEKDRLEKNQLIHSIRRNFGGLITLQHGESSDAMTTFENRCRQVLEKLPSGDQEKPPLASLDFLNYTLSGRDSNFCGFEGRYLLILTENLSVLSIIQDMLSKHGIAPEVVFGSKFPDDLSYKQVCENISKIRVCMASGTPMILLNLDDLYESLYDVLNQSFATWGDDKVVDIGLGADRVKAFVKNGFRLILVAGKDKVYSEFPIPLISRLEKHYISVTTLLTEDQLKVRDDLEKWMTEFVTPDALHSKSCPSKCQGCNLPLTQPYNPGCHYIGHCCKESIILGRSKQICPVKHCYTEIPVDYEWPISEAEFNNRQYFENSSVKTAFIGYSLELTAIAIRQAANGVSLDSKVLFELAKHQLMKCAAGESVLRLDRTLLKVDAPMLQKVYLQQQNHETLLPYLEQELSQAGGSNLLIQVTTFSQVMADADVKYLGSKLKTTEVCSFHVTKFTKESQFRTSLRDFYWRTSKSKSKLLIIQCESAHKHTDLLDAVRYIIQRESKEAPTDKTAGYVPNHTVLLLSISRGLLFSGYQAGMWISVHIDDPRPRRIRLPPLSVCIDLKPSEIVDKLLNDPDCSDCNLNNQDGCENPNKGILSLLKNCIPAALSIIRSSQGYRRISLLKDLIDQATPRFLKKFLEILRDLLLSQDEFDRTNWIKWDAVKASNMKTSETLRHAVEDSFERAIVPSMAAIISFVDVHQNLSLLKENNRCVVDMWLTIFEQSHTLGLQFDRQVLPGQSKLPQSFAMRETRMNRSVKFPFSWIVKETVENLRRAPNRREIEPGTDQFTEILEAGFEQSPIGPIVKHHMTSANSHLLLDAYLHDFVFLSHFCRSDSEHRIVSAVISIELERREREEWSPVTIDLAYCKVQDMLDNLSAILNINCVTDNHVRAIAELVDKQKMPTGATDHKPVPCDLIAAKYCLGILLASGKDQFMCSLQDWMDQTDRALVVMAKSLHPLKLCKELGAEADECRLLQEQLQPKKLYIEHVILPQDPLPADDQVSVELKKLAQCTESGEFHSYKTLLELVRFIDDRVQDGLRLLLPQCLCCTEPLKTAVKLPCGHLLCQDCFMDTRYCAEKSCGASIPADYQHELLEETLGTEGLKTYRTLRKRFTHFFMYFTSTLIFSCPANHADDRITIWLIETVFTDPAAHDCKSTLDVGPVLQSFLLKLFMSCERSDHIVQLLDEKMAKWSDTELAVHLPTMSLLINCHMDKYESDCNHEMTKSVETLVNDLDKITGPDANKMTVGHLKKIAEIKCHLRYAVKQVLLAQAPQQTQHLEDMFRDSLSKTRENSNVQPSYFVTRFLLKEQGESCLKAISNTTDSYLMATEIREKASNYTVPDILAVYGGEVYQDALNNLENFRERSAYQRILSCFNDHEVRNQHLLPQALFTKVTRTFSGDKCTPVPGNIRRMLVESLRRSNRTQKCKKICQILLDPEKIPQGMNVSCSKGIDLSMLILHLLSVMDDDPGELNPLVEIATHPEEAVKCLFPTMEDNPYDIQRESQKNHPEEAGFYGNKSWLYSCRNGHLYVIGDCGKPETTAKCHCGSIIGGEGHILVEENDAMAHQDRQLTPNGHCLGIASKRSNMTFPERELSALSCAVLRCLTHLFMYTSALINPDKAINMIEQGPKTATELELFLSEHINKDLEHISQCCDASRDDCILLLHDIINNMSTHEKSMKNIRLTTITERRNWEKRFNDKYLKYTLEQRETRIHAVRAQLPSGPGTSSVAQIVNTIAEPISKDNILASPGLWAYRDPLNLAYLRKRTQHMDYAYLKKFVEYSDVLIAISCIPDILALTKLLSEKFHCMLTRVQAQQMKVAKFCTEYDNDGLDLKGKIDRFIRAWNIMVKTKCNGIVDTIKSEGVSMAELLFDIHSPITNNTIIESGTVPFILLSFLVDKHNEMFGIESRERTVIALPDAIPSNLVSMSHEDEIVDLVQSYSEYEAGDRSAVLYNWDAIEKELFRRYIGARPKISSLTRKVLPTYVYQDDFSLLQPLEIISYSQERMDSKQEAKIERLLANNTSVSELTFYLKELQIIIKFFSGMRHIAKGDSLAEFANAIFEKNRIDIYLVPEVKQKHVEHVWFILKYTQAGILMVRKQDPFDDVSDSYYIEPTADMKKTLDDLCLGKANEVNTLLHILFEFIILQLNRESTSRVGKQIMEKKSLKTVLEDYIAGQQEGYGKLQGREYLELPAKLLVEHAVAAWRHIWYYFNY